jgi:hypothetical protein
MCRESFERPGLKSPGLFYARSLSIDFGANFQRTMIYCGHYSGRWFPGACAKARHSREPRPSRRHAQGLPTRNPVDGRSCTLSLIRWRDDRKGMGTTSLGSRGTAQSMESIILTDRCSQKIDRGEATLRPIAFAIQRDQDPSCNRRTTRLLRHAVQPTDPRHIHRIVLPSNVS